MTDAVPIARFLEEQGFEGAEAAAFARKVLEEASLTRPGKSAIASSKLARAREVLSSRIARTCGEPECQSLARGLVGRQVVLVAASRCDVCAGSNNRRSAAVMAAALGQRGLRRMLVVGGSPSAHRELEDLFAGRGIELRLVSAAEGTHTTRTARSGVDWADLIVVWGATPLPHKVSRLYTEGIPQRVRIVRLAKRGVEALCREVVRSLGREPG